MFYGDLNNFKNVRRFKLRLFDGHGKTRFFRTSLTEALKKRATGILNASLPETLAAVETQTKSINDQLKIK